MELADNIEVAAKVVCNIAKAKIGDKQFDSICTECYKSMAYFNGLDPAAEWLQLASGKAPNITNFKSRLLKTLQWAFTNCLEEMGDTKTARIVVKVLDSFLGIANVLVFFTGTSGPLGTANNHAPRSLQRF